MKKSIIGLLLLVLMFSLCACDSKNYDNAMALYNAGDFQAAKEIFDELADYEDAAQRSIDCTYHIAIELLNDNNYAEALTIFESILEYKDSKNYLSNAKWGLLYDYIQENGEIYGTSEYMALTAETTEDTPGTAYLSAISPDSIMLGYQWGYSESGVGLVKKFVISIEKDKTIAEWGGEVNTTILTSYVNETFFGKIDVSAYTSDTVLEIESYTNETKDIYGEVTYSTDVQDAIMGDDMTKVFNKILNVLPELLNETGISFTLTDLGFSGM